MSFFFHLMPLPLKRLPTTNLQLPSTRPLPMGQPCSLYTSYSHCPGSIANPLSLAAHLLHNLQGLSLPQHVGPAVMHARGLALILEQRTEVPQVFRGVVEVQDPH